MPDDVRVLILEDNASDARLMVDELDRAGLKIEWERVDSEPSYVKSLDSPPDVIIADVRMPQFGASRALQILRECGLDIPFIIVSGTIGDEAAVDLMRAGASDYLQKDRLGRLGQSTIGALKQKRLRDEREASERERELANARLQEALDDLRRAQAELVQRERLRALGEMASGIAHDFNNALTSMLGHSELLLADPIRMEDPETVRRSVELINLCARDAASTVRRLSEFYRGRDESEPQTEIDLDRLVLQCVATSRPKWKDQAQAVGRRVEVETDLAVLPPLMGEESYLREAFTNLIFNAVDAIPTEGSVIMRTREEAGGLVLEVEDTGIGMSSDQLDRCLDPFYTTKGEHGSGLGLSVTYGIVARHGGKLTIASVPGSGTTVRIWLPLRAVPSVAQSAAEAIPVGPLRVLVVDDEVMVRELICAFLDLDSHVVECAGGGAEALERYSPGDFDLVITDRAMPGMSGDELVSAIKGRSPEQRVLMLTGFGQLMTERPEGVTVVLSKPVTVAALRGALQEVMSAA